VAIIALAITLSAAPSFAQVKLNTWTAPDNGVAGISDVNVTGSGFPAGPIPPGNVTLRFSLSCGGPAAATTAANSVKPIIGTSDRIDVTIPSTLATGTYFISLSGTNSLGTSFNSDGFCSQVKVTHTNPTLSACVPSSSLGVLAPVSGPAIVTSYVPNGAWDDGFTGLQVVQIENPGGPLAAPIHVTTTGVVNSCAANPATGQVICVDNGTNVYELTGSTINTTLTSGSNTTAGFSGGSCRNCGVFIDALNNRAVINMGTTAGPGTRGEGVQFLDLNTNTFAPPFGMNNPVSENPLIDPTRALIVTPGEQPGNGNMTLLQVGPGTTLTEFGNAVNDGESEYDSAGEDCSTGIALSTSEFTGHLIVMDLTQAIFNTTTHTWTAGIGNSGLQIQNFPEFAALAAGTSGVAIAQGTSHLGIVAGEFGGNTFGVIQLPSTSGSGTPAVTDYRYATMPPLPTGGTFTAGLDPHTVTAYVSPNDGKAYALVSNGDFIAPTFVGKIDLACIMALPFSGHTVTGSTASCVQYFPTGN
jgi:hypothetical protein